MGNSVRIGAAGYDYGWPIRAEIARKSDDIHLEVYPGLGGHRHLCLPSRIELHPKSLFPSPAHHGAITGAIYRNVKHETVGNCDVGLHPQLRTVSVLVTNQTIDADVAGVDCRVLQNKVTDMRPSLYWWVSRHCLIPLI